MQAFVVVPGGLACELDKTERRIIARVVADTAELLGTALADEGAQPAADDADRSAQDAVLAGLDWHPADEQPPTDPALARLLPPASTEDEDLAAEMRRLTEGALRAEKVDRLRLVWSTLRASSGVVVVRDGAEGRWLAALNDVRLVLASRLGIDDEAAAEAVYERSEAGEPKDEAAALEAALSSLYTALTWWQESLLAAMSARGRGH